MGGFVLLRAIAALLVAVVLVGCSEEVSIAPPEPTGAGSAARAQQAQTTLDELESALLSGDAAAVDRLAAPAGAELLASVRANADALGIADLDLRYVDDAGPLTEPERAEASRGAGGDQGQAWRGTVSVTYRYADHDTNPARVESEFVFVQAEGQEDVTIAGIGGAQTRTPPWLLTPLDVVRTPRTLVAVAGGDAGRYPALVMRAVKQVERLLDDWDGSLVVEVPASQEQLDQALQASAGEYDNIAAVTTTADGALDPGAPMRILVNPKVFGRLKARGAQVVMSHEAVHVAVEAPFASMPTWLLEGFADWVALDEAGVPVQVAARQILQRIRKEGLPDGLPTSEDLSPTATGLGATYEEAWLACRYLAREYGDKAMLRLYRAVDQGSSSPEAFQAVLGITERRFVEGWRRDLARLAGLRG